VKTKPKSKAFTLIELLVVIAVIAVLVSMLLPALQNARRQARRMVCCSQLHHMALATLLYADDFNGKMPCDYVYKSYNPPQFFLGYSASVLYFNMWSGLGLLYDLDLVPDPSFFYCPGRTRDSGGTGGSYEYYSNLGDSILGAFPDPSAAGNIIYHNYMYRVGMAGQAPGTTWQISNHGNVVMIIDRFIGVVGGVMESGHGIEGINAAYADGSASWVTDSRIYDKWGYQGFPTGWHGTAMLDVMSMCE